MANLTTDPATQADFITKNPFFKALADDAQRRLFQNKASKGKVGSGETAKALTNSLLLLGNDLLGQDINRRFNLATLGSNAAAGQATTTLQTGKTIADLTTDIGNVQASGIIGKSNAIKGTITDIGKAVALGAGGFGPGGQFTSLSDISAFQAGAGGIKPISLSDRRMKEDINKVGHMDNGLPVYTFKYKGDQQTHMGVMAQEVEHLFPDAVHEVDGIKYVDYGALTWH